MGKVIKPNIPPHVLADMWQFMLKTSVPRILADHEKQKEEAAKKQYLNERSKGKEDSR